MDQDVQVDITLALPQVEGYSSTTKGGWGALSGAWPRWLPRKEDTPFKASWIQESWSKFCMAHGWIWQTEAIWFPHTWVYWWIQSKSHMAAGLKNKQWPNSDCRILPWSGRRVRWLPSYPENRYWYREHSHSSRSKLPSLWWTGWTCRCKSPCLWIVPFKPTNRVLVVVFQKVALKLVDELL